MDLSAISTEWVLAIGLIGVVITTCVQFHAFSSQERRKYIVPLILALLLLLISTAISIKKAAFSG